MWLITAGPTREHIDDVRFLSNASSGRMGYALAAEAARRGHEVVLVSGPVALPAPARVEVMSIVSAREMLDAARLVLEVRGADVLVGVAAVCDYRPAERRTGKPPKSAGGRHLELRENPDVIASLAALGGARFAVGFALEELGEGRKGLTAALQKARAKLERKRLDAVVLNGVATIDADTSRAWWVPRTGEAEAFGDLGKEELAAALVERLERESGAGAGGRGETETSPTP